MVQLAAGDERFRDDHGGANPVVTAALAAYAAGTGTEHAALMALAGARLLVPVVAVLADGETSEKASEMAMPALIGRDGRRALPAFTGLDPLRRWQPEARPVPVPASGVWQSAVQESCAVVIDIAGPIPLAVEGARLAALAAGAQVPGMHEDPDVWQLVAAAAAQIAPGIRIRVSAPQDGLDFTLEIAPADGDPGPVPGDVADRIAEAAAARLGSRVRSGIAVMLSS
jgi:SseB protein N-terminal domain